MTLSTICPGVRARPFRAPPSSSNAARLCAAAPAGADGAAGPTRGDLTAFSEAADPPTGPAPWAGGFRFAGVNLSPGSSSASPPLCPPRGPSTGAFCSCARAAGGGALAFCCLSCLAKSLALCSCSASSTHCALTTTREGRLAAADVASIIGSGGLELVWSLFRERKCD